MKSLVYNLINYRINLILIFLSLPVFVYLNNLLGGLFLLLFFGTYAFILLFDKARYERTFLLILISIFFPIYINIGGNDIGTLSNLLIFIGFLYYLLEKKITIDKELKMVLFIVTILLIVSFFVSPVEARFSSLRRSFTFLTNIFFMILIFEFVRDNKFRFFFYIDYIIILASFNAFVTILSANVPEIFDVQKFFLSQKTESYTSFVITDGVIRARSLIADYELTTEFLSIALILNITKLFIEKFSFLRVVSLIIMFAGLLYSGSRSMIILFIISVFMLLAVNFFIIKDYKARNLGILFFSIIIFYIISLLLHEQISNIIFRIQNIKIYGGIIDNREWIWLLYLQEFLKSPIIGNGYFRQSRINLTDSDPHSLYIHILFSFGLVGIVLFIIFIVRLLIIILRNIKYQNIREKIINSGFLISLMIFLIDQYKITFLREENYQLFIFSLFGLILSLKVKR